MAYAITAPVSKMVHQRNRQQEMLQARNKQQEEMNNKTTAYAEKQKEKQEKTSKLKIEKWEKMQGRGKGYVLDGGRVPSTPALAVVREKMQMEHDKKVATWVPRTEPTEEDIVQQNQKLREEAKRKKKIEDWERMHGRTGGQQVGCPNAPQPTCSFTQRSSVCGTSTVSAQSEPTVLSENQGAEEHKEQWEISEETKREQMRAARLRMQQAHDLKIAQKGTRLERK